MTLIQKQLLFSEFISQFMLKLMEAGYGVTVGEFWRSPETCAIYAAKGKGIKNSNHPRRISADINIFKDGLYLTRTESLKEAGEMWEAMSAVDIKCVWGGRFTELPDGNHFGFEHEGVS